MEKLLARLPLWRVGLTLLRMARMDLTGQRFDRLSVKAPAAPYQKVPRWSCECVCGTTLVVRQDYLRSGKTRSCGCLREELRATTPRTHGMRRSAEYRIWTDMRQRCTNPARNSYVFYGARGIRVCDEWFNSFEAFIRDVGPRPGLGYSIDRIDSNGHYEPGNVRWATTKQQGRNSRWVRLSEEDARQIRCARALGIEGTWLARLYGVSTTAIADINRGRTWT